jgi:hypothetical protein
MERSYQPVFDDGRVTCPSCLGTMRMRWCPNDDIPGAGSVTDFCSLCLDGMVIPAVARRYLLDMDDFMGLAALHALLEEVCGECPAGANDGDENDG